MNGCAIVPAPRYRRPGCGFPGTGAVQPRWESPAHRRYEALRAYLAEGLPAAEAAARFGQQHQAGCVRAPVVRSAARRQP